MTDAVQDRAALYAELLPLLHDPRERADGRVWSLCPVHPDGQKHGNRSLSLSPRYGLTCFAGCEFKAVVDALRKNGHKPPAESGNGTLVATYQYQDLTGKTIAEKARIEHPDGRKQFRWRLPGGKWGDGLGGLKMRDMPLYGGEAVVKADQKEPVWYVEGEKAQRAMALQGFLAVTHGGGSSTREFGDSLAVLHGREVVLWPDNDPPGREYMTIVMARLRGIASETCYANVPIALPEKGDAYDYFERGGTAEALKASLAPEFTPTEPTVELLGDDALEVTVPSAAGPIAFAFSAIETSGRRFDAELAITFSKLDPYNDRINLLSSTGRTELRRELDSLYGKEHEWTRVLNKAFGLARQTYLSLDRSMDVADAPAIEADRFAVDPLLPMNAPTIMFGDGSASKTMIACGLAFAFCGGLKFLGMATPGQPVLFVDWEDTFASFARRIRRIGCSDEMLLNKGLIQYWPANGIPLRQQADAIRAKVQKDGIGLVILDSVAAGCDGPAEDSVVANSYIQAVKRIGVTALCIAHITKAGQDDKPFGSTFWHNAARRTWFVKRGNDEDTDEIDVAMVCKKVNDGRKPRPISLKVLFSDPNGPIQVNASAFDETSELSKVAQTINTRILGVLRKGALTRAEIATALDVEEDKVRATMGKAWNKKFYQPVGSKWGLARLRTVTQDGQQSSVTVTP